MSIQLTNEQLQELGLIDHTPAQREVFYTKLGKAVFDSAILRLIETMDENQLYALNHAIDALDSFESVIAYLQQTYPNFPKYIEEEQDIFIGQVSAAE
tara:strand:+ start:402 stop:695 length:294 start_codon:yes stop_codon:yes gene_type:complete